MDKNGLMKPNLRGKIKHFKAILQPDQFCKTCRYWLDLTVSSSAQESKTGVTFIDLLVLVRPDALTGF